MIRHPQRVVSAPDGNGQNAPAPLPSRGAAGSRAALVWWPIRWCFLLFTFSIAFENVLFFDAMSVFTTTKFIGILLAAVALLQPGVCFARPPRAFWCFAAYLGVYTIRGLVEPDFTGITLGVITTLAQCLILFWISYNVLRYGRMWKSVFAALLLSNFLVAVMSYLGAASVDVAGELSDRVSVFGQNANTAAFLYALGFLGGLALLADKTNALVWRLAMIPVMVLLVMKCAATGSRSGMLCALMGILIYGLGIKGATNKVKGLFIAAFLGAIMAYIVLGTEVARQRWDILISEGRSSGRDVIYSKAWEMVLDKPLFGWGPTTHLVELADREGIVEGRFRDTHNDYLWALTATGLSGFVFFFLGLCLCLRQAWRGRRGPPGSLPLAFVCALLVICTVGTHHKLKPFWLIAAMACASGAVVSAQRAPPPVRRTA